MTDVTEHGRIIRADRMELITATDRVPERLRRLENAAAAGLLGGGGGAGSNANYRSNLGPAISSNATWVALDPRAAGVVIEPAGAFIENADKSISVLEAGWYNFEMTVGSTNAASGGVAYDNGIHAAFGTTSGGYDLLLAEGRGSALTSAIATAATTIKLTAGQKVFFTSYAASSMYVAIQRLTIARSGGPVGPTGPQGAQGAASTVPGPQGPVGAQGVPGPTLTYQQPADPDITIEPDLPIGAIWIDSDAVPIVSETIRTIRTGQSYVVGGPLTAGMVIPPFFVPVMGVGQTTKIIGARYKINSGTNVVARLIQNGSTVGSDMTVTTSKATTTFASPQTMGDGDEIGLVILSVLGAPMHLSLTVILEHTV